MDAFETLADDRSVHASFEKETNAYAQRMKSLIKGTPQLWAAGHTFRNACDISVLYVTGLLPSSPYHIGPILSESTGIATQLAACTRNGLLTTSSEPAQKDVDIYGEEFEVENASVQFWVQNSNKDYLMKRLGEHGTRFTFKQLPQEVKFSEEFGPSYFGEDSQTTSMFLTDTKKGSNEIYKILVDISREFSVQPRVSSSVAPSSTQSPGKIAPFPSLTPVTPYPTQSSGRTAPSPSPAQLPGRSTFPGLQPPLSIPPMSAPSFSQGTGRLVLPGLSASPGGRS